MPIVLPLSATWLLEDYRHLTTRLGGRPMRRRLIAILAILFVPSISLAEPTPSVQWLMNEPATLWDLGLSRIRINFAAYYDRKNLRPKTRGKYTPIIFYDWDQNRIKIRLYVKFEAKDIDDLWDGDIRTSCKAILQELNLTMHTELRVGSYFSHLGFKRNSEPASLAQEIDKITVLQTKISTDQDQVLCQFYQSEYSFIEEQIQ